MDCWCRPTHHRPCHKEARGPRRSRACRQPSIVDCRCGCGAGGSSGTSCVDSVAGVGKPIEHGLRANDDTAPELVVYTDLATTQKRSVRCGPKGAAKRVRNTACAVPT